VAGVEYVSMTAKDRNSLSSAMHLVPCDSSIYWSQAVSYCHLQDRHQ